MGENDPAGVPITTVEMHTGGEAVRIVTGGYPPIPGATILDKRRHAREHLDHLRKLIMFEPRGHEDMYGVIPVEPDHPDADMAVLFVHNEGYSTMCGHATIALGRYAVDHGVVKPRVPVTELALQCPCGLVSVQVEVEYAAQGFTSGKVRFESVPSFAFLLDQKIYLPEIGVVTFDIAYGGAFYVIASAPALGLDLRTSPVRDIVDVADRITKAVAKAVPLDHPGDADLAFLYGTILTDGRAGTEESPSRNVCVFAEREVDRSPTGSGVSARIAIFKAKATRKDVAGHFEAVRVEVEGRAYYTGSSIFTCEPGDDLGAGFLLR